MFTNHPVPLWQGERAVVSSGFRSSDRPGHDGADLMFERPEPGAVQLPHYARRYMHPAGLPALSVGPGVVSISRDISTGGYIKIEHADGWSSQYMHLRDRRVQEGETVRGGQPIGTIHHGKYPLIHLHLQLRRHGRLVDPESILAQLPAIEAPLPTLMKIALVGGAAYLIYRATQ